MGSFELTNCQEELFKHVTEGNVNLVKLLISDFKVSVNCYDDHGMTPLQHAAFKGHYEICKLLLGCGADANATKHSCGYSALCLAAITNHCEVIILLLEHGADASAKNSNNRTASEMAAFVGSHKAVIAINNYIPKDVVNYFSEPHGLEEEPKLPPYLTGPVHRLVIIGNIHPVRLILHFKSNNIILRYAQHVINVLNMLSEKQLKEHSNDRLSLKIHHIGFVLSSTLKLIKREKANDGDEVNPSEEKSLDLLIKSWLQGSNNSNISLNLEKFLRKSISAYPYSDCLLFQHIVSTISMTILGCEPNALTILGNSILGQHAYGDIEACATCGEQNSGKKCSNCKNVQYCDKVCQKLHWFIHKNVCKKN